MKGPGSGREAAIRALQAVGPGSHHDQGRDSHSSQRMPSPQETPRLIEGKENSNYGKKYTADRQALQDTGHFSYRYGLQQEGQPVTPAAREERRSLSTPPS